MWKNLGDGHDQSCAERPALSQRSEGSLTECKKGHNGTRVAFEKLMLAAMRRMKWEETKVGRVKLVRRLIQWSRGEMVVAWTKRMMTEMEKSEGEGGQEGG